LLTCAAWPKSPRSDTGVVGVVVAVVMDVRAEVRLDDVVVTAVEACDVRVRIALGGGTAA